MLILLCLSLFTFQPAQTPAATAASSVSPLVVMSQQPDGDEGKADILIEFEGNNMFTADDLRARMEYTKDAGLVARSSKQDFLERLDLDLKRMDNYMRSKGYLQARHGEPRVEYLTRRNPDASIRAASGSSNIAGLRVKVPIDEGRLYKIGEIRIEGNNVIPEQQIRAVIGLKSGDIANGEQVGKALYEDLKKLYGSHGYIQYTAEPTPTFRDNPQNPDEGLVDLEISIEEGQQFRVRSIKFAGNKQTPEETLQGTLLLHEGDIYSQNLFEESIRKLNQLGYFAEMVDQEKDVDVKVDKEGEEGSQSGEAKGVRELDITIRVKERSQQKKD